MLLELLFELLEWLKLRDRTVNMMAVGDSISLFCVCVLISEGAPLNLLFGKPDDTFLPTKITLVSVLNYCLLDVGLYKLHFTCRNYKFFANYSLARRKTSVSESAAVLTPRKKTKSRE